MSQAETYQAGVYLELHRFKKVAPYRGIDRCFLLTLGQLRALTAISVLLYKTHWLGNWDPEQITIPGWRHLNHTPVLQLTWKEYLDSYYGDKGNNGGHKGQQIVIAKKSLYDLCTKPMTISYYRAKHHQTISYWDTIIKEYKEKGTIIKRKNGLTLVFHPIFIDNVHNFHVVKPVNLFNLIRDYHKSRKVKKSVVLFIEWLLTLNKSPWPINQATLIERLWLEKLQTARQKARVDGILQSCYETAMGLGYLRKYTSEDGKLTFELNEALCSRVQSENKRKRQTGKN
jgi:hypothetical protein